MTSTNSDRTIAALAKIVGIIIQLPLSSIWRGYALSVLWQWFMVSAFGLPPLTIPLAIGLSLIVGFLVHQHIKQDVKLAHTIAIALLGPGFVLLTGWIVTKFI